MDGDAKLAPRGAAAGKDHQLAEPEYLLLRQPALRAIVLGHLVVHQAGNDIVARFAQVVLDHLVEHAVDILERGETVLHRRVRRTERAAMQVIPEFDDA